MLKRTKDNSQKERNQEHITAVSKHLMIFHVNLGVDLLCDALENRFDPTNTGQL